MLFNLPKLIFVNVSLNLCDLIQSFIFMKQIVFYLKLLRKLQRKRSEEVSFQEKGASPKWKQ